MSIKSTELIKWAETPGVSESDMARDLALHMSAKYEITRAHLDSLSKLYTGAIIALLVQITFFVINIWRWLWLTSRFFDLERGAPAG